MRREWRPGDVAMWIIDDSAEVIFRYVDYINENSHEWMTVDSGQGYPKDHEIRPLAVIDIEDHGVLDPIIDLIWGDRDQANRPATWQVREKLKSLLFAPPKPDEPSGKYAVVVDTQAVEWVRVDGPGYLKWHSIEGEGSRWSEWADIDVAKVLSEGVTP